MRHVGFQDVLGEVVHVLLCFECKDNFCDIGDSGGESVEGGPVSTFDVVGLSLGQVDCDGTVPAVCACPVDGGAGGAD